MEEIWKDIKEFEGKYQISNLGKVKSIDRKILQFNGFNNTYKLYKGKILKPYISNRGYLKVILYDKQKKRTVNIHRLVAETFIPNPDNLSQVNHIDENKQNNYVNNLEWCDSSYNINYGSRNEKVSIALKNVPKSEEHKKKISIMLKRRKKNNGRRITNNT